MEHFTARQYLQMDIASQYGLDKESWTTRLAWFHDNQFKFEELVKTAKEPSMFYAGVQAWHAVLQGEAIGYPISLDATASGFQLLAVLTGDSSAASLCNVIDSGNREDAYKLIYEAMVKKLSEETRIDRELVKDAIMTALYGSTAKPKEIFGEGELLNKFYETMEELAPAVWELNQVMLNLWENDVLSHDWVMPDNFHVHIPVMGTVKQTIHLFNEPHVITYKDNIPSEYGRSLGANLTHSVDGFLVRELTRRCDYRPNQVKHIQKLILDCWTMPTEVEPNETNDMFEKLWNHYIDTGYLSARILDYITKENIHFIDRSKIQELIDSLPAKPFTVISIHD